MTVVLITGALTGIGRATALAFAREGDQIVISGRHGRGRRGTCSLRPAHHKNSGWNVPVRRAPL